MLVLGSPPPDPAGRRRRPTRVVATGLAAALAVLAGCGAGGGSIRPVGSPVPIEGGSATRGELVWESCDDYDIDVPEDAADMGGGDELECARLAVPLDRDDPDGRTIAMAVARLAATGDEDERLGSLVVNPGGPGGSGLSMVALGSVTFPEELRRRWDIVGFDPRGLGASERLDCLDEDRRGQLADEDLPEDPAEAAEASEAVEEEIAEGCRTDDAELLERMGTSWVVDDLDELRAALGEERLHYLGLSYGTRIGALYAVRHPDRVGALVLDGAVSPDRSLATLPLGQATGIRRAFEGFLANCAARADCPLGADPTATFEAVRDGLDDAPVTYDGPDGEEELDADRFVTGVITSLYDATSAAPTELAIAALAGEDADRRSLAASFLGGLADQQDGRRQDGRYGNGFEVQLVVTCADAESGLDRAEGEALAAEIAAAGGALADEVTPGGASCVSLPAGRGDTAVTASPAASRVLVVGTAGDPATPVEWSTELADALGGSAVLRYEGRGHTSSLGVECVTGRVAAFLADPTAPVDTTACPEDPEAGDLFVAVARQFTAMGLPEDLGGCVADALRGSVDPLSLVAGGEDLDPEVIAAIEDATLGCIGGG